MKPVKRLALVAIMLTVAACASLNRAARTSAFNDDEAACNQNLDACVERCTTGNRGSCSVLAVLNAEDNPALRAFQRAHGVDPSDPRGLDGLKSDLERLCRDGIERACAAVPRVQARIAAAPPRAKPVTREEQCAKGQALLKRLQAVSEGRFVSGISASLQACPSDNVLAIAEKEIVKWEAEDAAKAAGMKAIADKKAAEKEARDREAQAKAESERQIRECAKDLPSCKTACEGGECFGYYGGLVAKGTPKQVLEGKQGLENLCSSVMTQPLHGAELACDHVKDWESRAKSCIHEGLAFCQSLCNTSPSFHLACYAAALDMISDKNVSGGLKFMEKACSPSPDQYGTSEACHTLGMRYFEGSDVPKDRSQSLKYMKLACSASKAELHTVVSDKTNTAFAREAASVRHNTYCGEVFGLQCVAKAIRQPAGDSACLLGRRQNLAYRNSDPECLNAMATMRCYERPGLFCCPPGM